jgi:hypothetical protein
MYIVAVQQQFSNFFGWWLMKPYYPLNVKIPFLAWMLHKKPIFYSFSNLATLFGHLATLQRVATPSLRTAAVQEEQEKKWKGLCLNGFKSRKLYKTKFFVKMKMNYFCLTKMLFPTSVYKLDSSRTFKGIIWNLKSILIILIQIVIVIWIVSIKLQLSDSIICVQVIRG